MTRHRGRTLAIVILGAAVGGCAGSGVARSPAPPAGVAATLVVPPDVVMDDRRLLHLLGRVTFGPRPGDLARVRSLGAVAYLQRQLRPERIDDAAVDAALSELPTLTMAIPDLLRTYPRPDPAMRERMASGQMSRRDLMEMYPPEKRPGRISGELQAAKMVRAVGSERQLHEVMVDFWFNHFNVFAQKGEVRWYVSAYEREAIRPHAFGKFRDLVLATARHPAMLYYLDNWLSVAPDFTIPAGPNRGRRAGLNENYARELMELHTLGVDGGYTQADVREVARAFTGWSIDRPQVEGRFVFRAQAHDMGEKVVLGTRIPRGGGEHDGERVIEILTRHPSTARFIATKLVRRFVADTPPPALVERVAGVYRATDGDIPSMLRAIVAAPEFWAPEAQRTKIKKPFEFVVSAVRALGGTLDIRGGAALARAAAEIGEPLYEAQPPTGHADRAEAWVNAGALLARMNFALDLTNRRHGGVTVQLDPLVAGVDRARPEAVLERLLGALLPAGATAETRRVLAAQLGHAQITRQTADDQGPAHTDVEKLAALVIGSPEFQRR